MHAIQLLTPSTPTVAHAFLLCSAAAVTIAMSARQDYVRAGIAIIGGMVAGADAPVVAPPDDSGLVAGAVACSQNTGECSLCQDCECPSELAKNTLTLPNGNKCWRCESPQCATVYPPKYFSFFFATANESCTLSAACTCPSPLTKTAFSPVTSLTAAGSGRITTSCYTCLNQSAAATAQNAEASGISVG